MLAYLECRSITVAILLVYMNQEVSLPVIGVHHLADVLGEGTTLLWNGLAPRLLEHQAERTEVEWKLGQEVHGLEDSL